MENSWRFPFRAMGSPCHIVLHARQYQLAQKVAEAVIADVETVESRYSRYRDNSLLNQVNRKAAHKNGICVDDEMAGLLDYAKTCHQQSDGLFDITSGVLGQAWKFNTKQQKLPDPHLITRLLESVGFEKLTWEKPHLRFNMPGMTLDFGGIAKEYAADRAVAICQNFGIQGGVVNFGGDLRIIGPHPDGSPWEIGINHPRHPGLLLATLHLNQGAVTTSGDYERCIIINGRRYAHILNPLTGWPVEGLASVSVVAPFALIAGSASTIAMLKGRTGPDWLKTMELPALWVDEDGQTGEYRPESGSAPTTKPNA